MIEELIRLHYEAINNLKCQQEAKQFIKDGIQVEDCEQILSSLQKKYATSFTELVKIFDNN